MYEIFTSFLELLTFVFIMYQDLEDVERVRVNRVDSDVVTNGGKGLFFSQWK